MDVREGEFGGCETELLNVRGKGTEVGEVVVDDLGAVEV